MGKHLTLRGGSDLDKIFRGGGFFGFLLGGGDRFFDLEGRADIPFRKLLLSLVSNLSQSPENCRTASRIRIFR